MDLLSGRCLDKYYSRSVGAGADVLRVQPALHGERLLRDARPPGWGALAATSAVLGVTGIVVVGLQLLGLTRPGAAVVGAMPGILPGYEEGDLRSIIALALGPLWVAGCVIALAVGAVGALALPFAVRPRARAILREVRRRAGFIALVAGLAAVWTLPAQAAIGAASAPFLAAPGLNALAVSAIAIIPLALYLAGLTYLVWLIPTCLAEDLGPGALLRRGWASLHKDHGAPTFWPVAGLVAVPVGFAWVAGIAAAGWRAKEVPSPLSYLPVLAALVLAGLAVYVAAAWLGRIYLARQPFYARVFPGQEPALLPRLQAMVTRLGDPVPLGVVPQEPGPRKAVTQEAVTQKAVTLEAVTLEAGQRRPDGVRVGGGRTRHGWRYGVAALVALAMPAMAWAALALLDPMGLVQASVQGVDQGDEQPSDVLGAQTLWPVGYGEVVFTGGQVADLTSGGRGLGFASDAGTMAGDGVSISTCDPYAPTCPDAQHPQQVALLEGAAIVAADGAGTVALSGWLPESEADEVAAGDCAPYECRDPGPYQQIYRLVVVICEPADCVPAIQRGEVLDTGVTTNVLSTRRTGQVTSEIVALREGRFSVAGWRPQPNDAGGDTSTLGTLSLCTTTGCDAPVTIGEPTEVFALAAYHTVPVLAAYDIATGDVSQLTCPMARCDYPERTLIVAGPGTLPPAPSFAPAWSSYRLTDAVVWSGGAMAVGYIDPVSEEPTIIWCESLSCDQSSTYGLGGAGVAQRGPALAAGGDGAVYYTWTDTTTGELKLGRCTWEGCDATDRVTLAHLDPARVSVTNEIVAGPSQVSLSIDDASRPIVAFTRRSVDDGPGQGRSYLVACAKPACGIP